jgi:DnaJ-domain-containing protein 1
VSLLDYFFSHFVDTGTAAEDLLAAAAWHAEHDERRRYHFERDQDYRYSGRSFFKRLRPAGKKPEPAARRARARVEPRLDDGEPPPPPRPAPERRIPSPEEVLGLRIGASDREVRAAFHRLAVQYHPDKVRHLGEEFERVAGEKFLALKEAYEKLIARRGAHGRA